MPDKRPEPKLKLSDGLYRLDHPDSDIFLPKPVRESSVERSLGDYINNLYKKLIKPNKPEQPSIADKPVESKQRNQQSVDWNIHKQQQPAKPYIFGEEWTVCPDSNGNRYCHQRICSIGCKSISQRENRKQQSEYWNQNTGSWPCVVVGVVCETNVKAADDVCVSPDNSGFAK